MKFKLLIALAAVFSLVAAACGDDDTADGGAADTTADSAAGGGTVDIDGILAADLGACAEAPAGDSIKVGMAMDFSDVVGFVDIPGSKLVPHVADLANCAGGVDGRPVRLPRRTLSRRRLPRPGRGRGSRPSRPRARPGPARPAPARP